MKSQPKNKAPQKVPVNERALFARLDRAFDKQGRRLRRAPEGSRACLELGRYFVIDVENGFAWRTHIGLEETAREMGVLKSYEYLAEPEPDKGWH